MLDPKLVRERIEVVEKGLSDRGYPASFLSDYADKDRRWRDLLMEVENLKAEQKKATPKGKPEPDQMERLKALSDQIKSKNDVLLDLEKDASQAALLLPNLPAASVPFGKSEEDNIEIRRVGEPRKFDFTPKPHEEFPGLDFDGAAKISGARFAVYRGWAAKLERALINFMLETHAAYEEILPPVLVSSAAMTGTGQLPKFDSESFRVADTDYWLSPTAEVQLTNLFRDQVIPEEKLPIKMTAYTPCFRKEAGSYGKDVKGIIRLHQFNKVELVQITKPEDSERAHEALTADAEKILQALGLPYRVIALCTGDLGFSAAKTYDIEVWFPTQNRYREISSCSNFGDFQARRAMIRYKNQGDGKTSYAHTLNGSALAVGRTFAAILENFQNSNGDIDVPEALQPYLGERKLVCK